MKRVFIFALATGCFVFSAFAEKEIWMSDLKLPWLSKKNFSRHGEQLCIGGQAYARGFGSLVPTEYHVLVKKAFAFDAVLGIHGGSEGRVAFRVEVDGKPRVETAAFEKNARGQHVHVDLRGAEVLSLVITDGGAPQYGVTAEICDPLFTVADGGSAEMLAGNYGSQLGILTPPVPAAPRIVHPKSFGVRPGHPIVFTVPATGERPMTVTADRLPEGVSLDPATGILSGSVAKPGDYTFTLTAKNAKGTASSVFTLKVGNLLAVTPPMGWCSWNAYLTSISDENIQAAAKALRDTGLVYHGWQYVNMDDGWERKIDGTEGPCRDGQGRMLTNKRFKDMKALTDSIHRLGLKAGLYSSPGPFTCGQRTGSFGHEEQDARTFAEWGFDYLKYDYCSFGSVPLVEGLTRDTMAKQAYARMGRDLRAQNRDILFSLCGASIQWAYEVGGSCWRTSTDVNNQWSVMRYVIDTQVGLAKYSRPGGWNDADQLVSGASPNELYTQMSLWCLLSSPLQMCWKSKALTPFLLSLYTNDEVIEIDQDSSGRAAERIFHDVRCDVWAKPMPDGSLAAALINRSILPQTLTFAFADAGLKGKQRLRDLWRQKDIGLFQNSYSAEVLGHACQLIRLWPATNKGKIRK